MGTIKKPFYLSRWFIVKPIYMRSCHCFHTHKAPHPPSGRVGDVVAMLQIEFSGIGNHGEIGRAHV